LHGALGKDFFKKNKKPYLPTAFAPGTRHKIFSKKVEKTSLPTASARGSRHKIFLKNENPLFADGPDSRLSAKKFSKTVILTPVNGYFFWPTAHCGHTAQPVARA
jgi:hypothetical protein